MGTIVEVIPEKLISAETELELTASMLDGIQAPVYQGEGKGRTVTELDAVNGALSGLARSTGAACRAAASRIRAVRVTLTEADQILSEG